MELRWLTTFVTVVDERGFANAAAALYCSQPTVSGQIADLERELSTRLFVRDRRPVQLTQAGEVFLVHARSVLAEIEAARTSVSDIVGLTKGNIRLGAYPSATAGYIPELLHRFAERYPGIRIQLTELGGAFLHQAALDGEVELFLRQTMPPVDATLFAHAVLWQEDFKVVVHPDHPLGRRRSPVPPSVLLEHPLITTGKYHPDSLMAHPFWRSLGQRPTVSYEVSQPQSLIALVRAGMGVGVTTALALRVSETAGLKVRAIDSSDAVREVALYHPCRRPLSPAASALAQFIRHEAPLPPDCRPPGEA